MKHVVCTAVKISCNLTQIKIQQGICVSKYLIICTPIVENVLNAKQWSKR
jgi:hypothetical protein